MATKTSSVIVVVQLLILMFSVIMTSQGAPVPCSVNRWAGCLQAKIRKPVGVKTTTGEGIASI